MSPERLRLSVPPAGFEVGACLLRPPGARALLVLAHGAGAGMHHVFMDKVSERLAGHGVASLRYEFPYLAAGKRRPDPPPVLEATVRSAVARAAELAPELTLLAGGKSMGGRMTSQAAASEPLPGVRGLIFFGFPLHPAGRSGTTRAAHLVRVALPLLFLQGERDRLCDLVLLRPLLEPMKERAELIVIPEADHSFHVPKRSGRRDEEVLDELAGSAAAWVERLRTDGQPGR